MNKWKQTNSLRQGKMSINKSSKHKKWKETVSNNRVLYVEYSTGNILIRNGEITKSEVHHCQQKFIGTIDWSHKQDLKKYDCYALSMFAIVISSHSAWH